MLQLFVRYILYFALCTTARLPEPSQWSKTFYQVLEAVHEVVSVWFVLYNAVFLLFFKRTFAERFTLLSWDVIKCAHWSWLWETKIKNCSGTVWSGHAYEPEPLQRRLHRNLFLPVNWTEADFKIPKTADHISPLFEHDDDSVAYNIQLACTSVHITLWNLVK